MAFFPLILILLTISPEGMAQRKHLKGRVVDGITGERIIDAQVIDLNNQSLTTTNDNGEFIIFSNQDELSLRVQHISYIKLDTTINLTVISQINIPLFPHNYELQDVTIQFRRSMERENSTIVSQRLDTRQLNSIPGLLGEKDIVKGLMLLPGVSMGSETSSSFHVRGGNPDQNLILIDGIPVYNISHLFGIYSVFIPEAIQEVELIKGGFPARYGGRLSSVCDIKMREGDRYGYKYDFSVGTISSKIVAEGPIIKDRSSFIISARRTYLDLITMPFQALAQEEDNYKQTLGGHFYDVVVKANHRINNRNNVFFSLYSGRDAIKAKTKETYPSDRSINESTLGLDWGNFTWILRLFSSFASSTYSNLSVSQSNYNYGINSNFTFKSPLEPNVSATNSYASGIVDWALRWDINHQFNNHLSINGGVHSILHLFSPGKVTQEYRGGSENLSSTEGTAFLAPETSAYSELSFSRDKLNLSAGLRFNAYFPKNTSYTFVEPRLAIAYRVNSWIGLKSGYSIMNQSILLLSSNGIGLPVDLWVPATSNVRPQRGVQYDFGFSVNPPHFQSVNISLVGYYKQMNNVVEIAGGMSLMQTATQWEKVVLQGMGESYGTEILIEKSVGKLTGWFAYTLSWNNRFFEALNQGKPFPYKYDNRHVVNIVATYKARPSIELTCAWSLQTGGTFSLPVGMYPGNPEFFPQGFYDLLSGNDVPFPDLLEYYPYRNNARMPSYHRLDIGANFTKKKSKGIRIWEVGIYNAYSQKNPYYLYWDVKDGKKVLRQFTLLPFLPSVTYRYKF
jgi:hypothetical protein